MKSFMLFLLIGVSAHLVAQKEGEPAYSLKNKNIEQFTAFFNNPIDLNIPNAKANYSDNQGKILVEKFFKDNSLSAYETKHTGGGNGRPFFEIGKLETATSNFRTYLLFQKNAESIKIIELRIEEE